MYLSQIVSVTVSTLNVGKRLNKQRLSKNKERNCNHKFSVRQMRLGKKHGNSFIFPSLTAFKSEAIIRFWLKMASNLFCFF